MCRSAGTSAVETADRPDINAKNKVSARRERRLSFGANIVFPFAGPRTRSLVPGKAVLPESRESPTDLMNVV